MRDLWTPARPLSRCPRENCLMNVSASSHAQYDTCASPRRHCTVESRAHHPECLTISSRSRSRSVSPLIGLFPSLCPTYYIICSLSCEYSRLTGLIMPLPARTCRHAPFGSIILVTVVLPNRLYTFALSSSLTPCVFNVILQRFLSDIACDCSSPMPDYQWRLQTPPSSQSTTPRLWPARLSSGESREVNVESHRSASRRAARSRRTAESPTRRLPAWLRSAPEGAFHMSTFAASPTGIVGSFHGRFFFSKNLILIRKPRTPLRASELNPAVLAMSLKQLFR